MIQKLFLSDRQYAANVAATFLSQTFAALSVILLTPILLKTLGETDFAVYGLILNAIVWGGIMDFGMNTGMLRRLIHEGERSTALFSSVVLTYVGLFLVCCLLLLLVQWSGSSLMGGMNLLHEFAALLLMLQNVVATLLDVMIQSSQKIFRAKLIRIGKIFVEFACIYFTLEHGALDRILLIMVLVNFFYIFFLFGYARKAVAFRFDLRAFDWSVLRGHLQYSFWYFLTTLSGVLVFNSQVFLIDRLAGATLLAQYIVLLRFFEIIRTSVSNFTVVLFPSIVAQEKAQDRQQLLQLLWSAFRRTSLLLGILFVVLYAGGEWLLLWWTKSQFSFDSNLFLLMLIFTMLILVDNVSALFLSALMLNRLPTIVSLVQGSVALLLTALSVGSYGLMGAVASSLLALVLTNLFFNPIYLINKLRG